MNESSARLLQNRVEQLRLCLEARTPGRWLAQALPEKPELAIIHAWDTLDGFAICQHVAGCFTRADAELIVQAVAVLPELLEDYERLRRGGTLPQSEIEVGP